MAQVLRPISHDDRLSIVEHLDELRSRLIICGVALAVAFGLCFWQNQSLLKVLNRALPHSSSSEVQRGLAAVPNENSQLRGAFSTIASGASSLAAAPGLSAQARKGVAKIEQGAKQGLRALPRASATAQEKPITIGVGEPFMTTLAVCAYFALLFALPLLIYEGYAFVIPALNADERRVAIPVMSVAPLLFIVGVVFAYAVVLPPAVHFLQGYNSGNFDILVQAKTYYTFEILTMLGIGLAFQLPLGLLGLQRLGVINSSTLTRHWRYAIVMIAVIAAAMPGSDPVTTALEASPLVILFLVSIVVLKIADRRAAARTAAELAQMGDSLDLT
jgi:sec-independent protein translocase protein TatC